MRGLLLILPVFWIWAATFPSWLAAQTLSNPPEYSANSITNAASSRPGRLASNSIVTIYGQNLSNATWAISPADIRNGNLPVSVPGLNVVVALNDIQLPLYYVSPTQINALIPATIRSSQPMPLAVRRGLIAGPPVSIVLLEEAPEFFRVGPTGLAATHADGSLIDAAHPATANEVIVIYGTAFGPTDTSGRVSQIPTSPSSLVKLAAVRIRLNDDTLPPGAILYAGVTPGFAGLYQVNVRLPASLPLNPTLRLGVEDNWSAPDTTLPTEPQP